MSPRWGLHLITNMGLLYFITFFFIVYHYILEYSYIITFSNIIYRAHTRVIGFYLSAI